MNAYTHIIGAVAISPREGAFIGERATQIAKAVGATLTLIHVVEPREWEMANPPIEDSILKHAREGLDRVGAGIQPQPKLKLAVGSARYEICDAAEQENADLIVVGTHGRHGAGRLLGSVASAVVHSAPCDVLVVHIPDEIR